MRRGLRNRWTYDNSPQGDKLVTFEGKQYTLAEIRKARQARLQVRTRAEIIEYLLG